MRKTVADKKRRIQWNLTTVWDDLDFFNNTALLSSKFDDLCDKTRIFM